MAYTLHGFQRKFIPFLNWVFLGSVQGIENIPSEGPFILACNHVAFPDTWVIGNLVFPRIKKPTWFMARDDFWIGRRWTAFVAPRLGALLIDWRNPSEVLERSRAILDNGGSIGIFPEGSRNYNKNVLLKGKTGAARLALASGCPVIPAGYAGPNVTNFREFIYHFALNRHTAKVRIGKAIDFFEYSGKEITSKLLYSATDKLMVEIGRLSGKRAQLHT